MGSKTHKQAKRFSAADLYQRAQRSLEKQDFKQAYKDAKVCYQQESSQKHRHLLERAWLSRALAQHRAGFTAESRESAQGLLDFGVTDPGLRQPLSELLVAVGLLDRALCGQAGVQVEVRPELLASAADQAVLTPATAPKSLPEIVSGAARVRAALDALYRGDDPAALEQLKDIPRSSPFADWRYFVRGLAAYYRGETSEMRAQWDRLEAGRFGAKIAVFLDRLAKAGSNGGIGHANAAMGVLEKMIAGESLTMSLGELPRCLAEDDAREALRTYRRCRVPALRVASELLARVEQLLCAHFIRKGEHRAFEELIAVASAPPMDPHWNRAKAMLWEHPDGDVDHAERFWRQYIEDLANLPALEPSQRPIAQALVWQRIGGLCVECAEEEEDWPEEEEDKEEAKEERARAVACFRQAIRLAPGLLSAYEALAAAYLSWGQRGKAAETFRRLLKHFPDHLDALRFLYQYHSGRGEPIPARDYALNALQLKPSNPELVQAAWGAHVSAARQFALEGKFDLGRAEFAAAERLPGDHGEPFHLLGRKAIFEFKAGNAAEGQRLADEALASLEEPAPALLVLLIEATRYELPYQLGGAVGDLEWRWRESLKKKRQGKTAGRLARIVTSFLASETDYAGRSSHIKQVFNYVKHCGRVRWEAADLRDVCLFIKAASATRHVRDTQDLLKKLVREGLKKFPEVPDFTFMAGSMEIEKGPARCNRALARRYFEQARDLAKKSSPENAFLAEKAERELTFLAEVSGSFWMPEEDHEDEDEEEPDDKGLPDDLDLSDLFDSSPGKMFKAFAQVCRSLGLNPQQVVQDMMGGREH